MPAAGRTSKKRSPSSSTTATACRSCTPTRPSCASAGGEVVYAGATVDLAYRDYPVADLLTLAAEGVDVEPMRLLFRQNRVISSIAAELDQKSCWEILTDPDLSRKYFSPDERLVFRRHVLWTRLLSDRRTALPDGPTGDLLPFARRERESLVLKPNRSFRRRGRRHRPGAGTRRNGNGRSTRPWPTKNGGSCSSWPASRSTSSRWSGRTGRCMSSRFTR